MFKRRKLVATLVAAASVPLMQPGAHAALVLHDLTTIILNFDNLNTDFGGQYNATGGSSPFSTAATGPTTIYAGTDGTLTPSLITNFTDYSPGGVYSNTGAYSNSNSQRALQNGSTTDLALGMKDSANHTYTLQLTNNTGNTLTHFDVSYNVEQYSIADSASTIALTHSTNGTTFVTANQTGGAAVAATSNVTGSSDDGNLATVRVVPVTASIDETIPAGSDFYLRWTYTHISGTSVHLGIDDVAVTPAPEPASTGLLLGGAMVFGLRRRRRSAAK
jgi:hypothetical protein